jgi:hypothetical protein
MSNEEVSSPVSESDSEDQPIQFKCTFKGACAKTENQDADNIMPPLLKYIDTNVIGRDTDIDSPYGMRKGVQ